MTVLLRPATREDAPFILMLEELGMRGYAQALWGSWQPSATVESLALEGHEIIEAGGESVGCIATAWHPDHLRVQKLYIHPDHRNRGFGAQALRTWVAEAAERGLPTWLSVLTTNPAQKFYEREGFSVREETRERRLMVRLAPSR